MTATGPAKLSWGAATPHPAATDAAAAVLRQGGTAVDAALAGAGVLAVVYPHQCSIGGDLIALVRKSGELPKAVFGVGRAALALDAGAFRRMYGSRVPSVGPHSISVPGVVSGWQAMHALGGRRPLAALLEPAIELASDGFDVSASLTRALRVLEHPSPELASVFGPPGARLCEGDVVVQPHLAETLAQVGDDPGSYYRGALAERLIECLAAAGSPLTVQDFSDHEAVVADAASTDAGVLAPTLFTASYPSQGVFFAILAKAVGGLYQRGFDLTGSDAAILARAFEDVSALRDELLCDPSKALDPDRIEERVAALDLGAGASANGATVRAPVRSKVPSGDTVAVVTHDARGNSVSLLQSVFSSFGSRVLDPATGVLFHSRQSMFSLSPGAPGELGPCLMPPHTLCPTMVDDEDGHASVILSAMGGRAQPQILVQVLLQLLGGKSASEALAAPRYVVGDLEHEEPSPLVMVEDRISPDALSAFAAGGFDVQGVGSLSDEMGHAQLIRVADRGACDAAADPRSDGTAALGH